MTQGQGGGGAERAEAYLRRMAETCLRRARNRPRSPSAAAAAREEVWQVRAVAAALVSAGVLDDAGALPLVQGLEADPGLRSRDGLRRPRPLPAAMRPGARAAAPALPSGPVLAVPASAAAAVSQAGKAGERAAWRPLVLVLAPDRVTLTVAARLPGTGEPHAGPFGINDPGRRLAAADDRGNSYRLGFSGGDSFDMTWSCGQFDLSPLVPPGARWLQVTLAPGAGPLRVDLGTPPAPTQIDAGPPPSPAAPGEHVLDAIAQATLWRSVATGRRGDRPLPELADVIAALQTAGALEPASPAAARLAALARRLGIGSPAGLPTPDDLPEPWASVLHERDRRDGPTAVAPAAAVLPEIDGARFALAGLHSTAEAATLRVLAWGWAPHQGQLRATLDPFIWQARDNTGRWHIAGLAGSGGNGHVDLYLTLLPPLHPKATSLDVTLTGRSHRVHTTVPLNWQTAQ
jgi:hypothetical protein